MERIESPATATSAADRFVEDGCLILGNALPTSFVADLYGAFLDRYRAMTAEDMEAKCHQGGFTQFFQVGDRRYEIAATMEPPFSDPQLYTNDLIRSVLDLLLGTYKVSSFTVVVSYPGADTQHVHRDHAHLFERETVGRDLPPHAINVAIPLVDIDADVGSTV